MHIWTNLLAREGALLAILVALGAAPAAFLSQRVDAVTRVALAPSLGFCLGTCFTTTVLQFVAAGKTYWVLLPLAGLSAGIAWRRTLRSSTARGWRGRLPLRDLAQLLLVCVAVAGPLTYTLHEHQTVGPAAYTYTDVDNYVAEEDGARATSISDARDAWRHAQETGARFGDLTQWDWSFFAAFNANPNSAPLDANVDELLGLGATDTNSAFLIVLLLSGALGAFAAVRYVTRSNTWMAALAGVLFGGPLFLELWFDTFQPAIIAVGLVMPFAILGSEALHSRRAANLVLFALVLATSFLVYPVLAPLLIAAGALTVGWHALFIWRQKGELRPFAKPAVISLGTIAALVAAFDNVGLSHSIAYYHKLINNEVPLPRVSWHLPLQVLPGWLLQTREFWYMPSLGVGGFKQIALGALIPAAFVCFIVVGVRKHRPALALVALAGVCAVAAEYAYASRNACTYCAERDLLPVAPIAAVLLTLGLAATLATPHRWMRLAGLVGVALVVISVGQRARVELHRFTDGSYFLDSANRGALKHLPPEANAVQLEGYGQTLSAQAEQPLVYHLANEHARGRVSVVLASDLNNATQYLDFGVVKSPGPEFHPYYNYVLTRFAGIQTGRRVIARSGGIALEQRTDPLDVTPYSGLAAPVERLDTSGAGWVQPGLPLQMYVTGRGAAPVWARLTLALSEPASVTPQAGVRTRQHGELLIACVRATGSAPIREASLQITASPVPGHFPAEAFPPPVPSEGIRLAAMQALGGRCTL